MCCRGCRSPKWIAKNRCQICRATYLNKSSLAPARTPQLARSFRASSAAWPELALCSLFSARHLSESTASSSTLRSISILATHTLPACYRDAGNGTDRPSGPRPNRRIRNDATPGQGMNYSWRRWTRSLPCSTYRASSWFGSTACLHRSCFLRLPILPRSP